MDPPITPKPMKPTLALPGVIAASTMIIRMSIGSLYPLNAVLATKSGAQVHFRGGDPILPWKRRA